MQESIAYCSSKLGCKCKRVKHIVVVNLAKLTSTSFLFINSNSTENESPNTRFRTCISRMSSLTT